MCADDIITIITANSEKELETKASEALTELETFFVMNGLKLNSEKTQIVKLCTAQIKNKLNTQSKIIFQGKKSFLHTDTTF